MVALGSTTFDGVTRTQMWVDLTSDLTGSGRTLADTAGLLWAIGTVALAYIGAMRVAAGLVGYERSPEELRAAFVHSLVPIALAYAVAHYFSLLVLEGQAALALAQRPARAGLGPVRHRRRGRSTSPSCRPSTVAYVQAVPSSSATWPAW